MSSVLERWSRRKRGLEADTAPGPATAQTPVAGAPVEAEAAPAAIDTAALERGALERGEAETAEGEETEAELLERLGLPDPDTVGPGGDLKRFMDPAVPKFLRRRAMRALWRSNPVFANLDGLNDYDDDYSVAAVEGAAVKTAYAIGRGFRKLAGEAEGDAQHGAAAEPDARPSAETAAMQGAPGAADTVTAAGPQSGAVSQECDDGRMECRPAGQPDNSAAAPATGPDAPVAPSLPEPGLIDQVGDQSAEKEADFPLKSAVSSSADPVAESAEAPAGPVARPRRMRFSTGG
ncbi:hypothetical protein ATO13_18104 [Stappia sp. 22II-S9-Z10]|nr:hypothetical protein ATO13_18104 [Stappia sp. 22II-S9-Z10]